MNIKEGDLVILKSGGAIMTVTSVAPTHIDVVWSDGHQNHFEKYPRHVLQKVELTDI